MRSPPVVPYIFALESAMDELAVKSRWTRWSCAASTIEVDATGKAGRADR